jgi:hypothetical protein
MKRDSHGSGNRKRKGAGRFFTSALFIAIVIFIVVWAVTHFWSGGGSRTAKNRAPATVTSVMPKPAKSLAGFSLVLIRCRHSKGCPYYDLHVKGKTLTYSGVRDVAKRGNVRISLSPARKRKLLTLVQKARFFGLGDAYGLTNSGCHARRTDAPTFTLGVTLNGVTKIVTANRGCANVPARLIALANAVDRVTHSTRWTGAPAPATATATAG